MTSATITIQRASGTPVVFKGNAERLRQDFPSLARRFGSAEALAAASKAGRVVVDEEGHRCEVYGSCGTRATVTASKRPAAPIKRAPVRASGGCRCATLSQPPAAPAPSPKTTASMSGEEIWEARADVRECFANQFGRGVWLTFWTDCVRCEVCPIERLGLRP